MKKIRKTTIMLATFAAILSLGIGFAPQVMGGTTGTGSASLLLTIDPDCGFVVADVNVAQTVDPGTVFSATFTVSLANSGTATLPVGANIGDSTQAGTPVGGFATSPREATTDVHILPADTDMNANLGGPGGTTTIGGVGTVAMNNDGSDVNIASLGPTSLQGENGPRIVTITADLTNLQNLPANGLNTADATFTGGLCA